MDISFLDGTLSLNNFSLAAHAFAEKWKRNNSASPHWLWVNCRKRPLVASQEVSVLNNFSADSIETLALQFPMVCFRFLLFSLSCQVEGYLSLENICLPGSSEVWSCWYNEISKLFNTRILSHVVNVLCRKIMNWGTLGKRPFCLKMKGQLMMLHWYFLLL